MEKVKGLFVLVAVLLLFMGANILLGCAKAGLTGTFDRETLKKGSEKAGCIAVSFILLCIAGVIAPEIELSFGGADMTTIAILKAILIAGIALYARKAFVNFKDVLGIDTKPEQITVYESVPEETEEDGSVG